MVTWPSDFENTDILIISVLNQSKRSFFGQCGKLLISTYIMQYTWHLTMRLPRLIFRITCCSVCFGCSLLYHIIASQSPFHFAMKSVEVSCDYVQWYITTLTAFISLWFPLWDIRELLYCLEFYQCGVGWSISFKGFCSSSFDTNSNWISHSYTGLGHEVIGLSF